LLLLEAKAAIGAGVLSMSVHCAEVGLAYQLGCLVVGAVLEPGHDALGRRVRLHRRVALLEEPFTASIVQDHYEWWADHGEAPSAGKPFWLTRGGACHHVFLDDHVRNDDRKSIVAARFRAGPDAPFDALDGPATRALHGVCLVRVPTLLPLRDERWFLKRIADCERRRAEEG